MARFIPDRRRKKDHNYDPTKNGALCKSCPLQKCTPVPARVSRTARLLVVGEAPGYQEEADGRYFVGESGRRLDSGCIKFGIDRERDLDINNVLQCRPQTKLSPAEWKQAIACCAPRLQREIKRSKAKQILTLGRHAMQGIMGIDSHMKNWLGAAWTSLPALGSKRTLSTIHPAFAMRGNSQYFPVFYTHLGRAWALATGQEKVVRWPRIRWKDKPATLDTLRKLTQQKQVAVDVESAGADPEAPITTIGFSTARLAVSISWPPERFFSPSRAKLARKLINQILSSPTISKIMHNGLYDVTAFKSHGFEIRGRVEDTILKHHVVAPQLRHGLQIASLLEFAADPWKTIFQVIGDEKGSEKFAKALDTEERRRELCIYNGKDCVATYRLDTALDARLKDTHNGQQLYEGYLNRSWIALRMRTHGACVNVGVLERHEAMLKSRRARARLELEHVGRESGALTAIRKLRIDNHKKPPDKFNPGSGDHLAVLFFEVFGCHPYRYSQLTGKPSLDKRTLRLFLVHGDPVVRAAARAVIRYRRWTKLLRTYVQQLKYDEKNILHPDAKVWGTRTGRWSYGSRAQPFNPQTLPQPRTRKTKKGKTLLISPGLRDIIGPRKKGNWIVECDYSQLEARIIALLAGDTPSLEVFKRGDDLHDWTATMLFGLGYLKRQRTLAKIARYSWQYDALPKTAWLSLVVDAPDLLLSDVERLWEQLNTIHPHIKQWQWRGVEHAKREDYVEAPLSGRRFHFFSEVEPAKVYNLPVQGSGADLIDVAIEGIDADLRWGKEFLLFQVHDAVVLEGPDPVRLCRIAQKHMAKAVTLNGQQCVFPVDFKVSQKSWGEGVECKSLAAVKVLAQAV